MAGKITEYPIEATDFEEGDLIDISKRVSTFPDVFESQKAPATLIQGQNLFGKDQTLGANRDHDLASFEFKMRGGSFIYEGSDTSISTDDFNLKNQASEDLLKVFNGGLIEVSKGDLNVGELFTGFANAQKIAFQPDDVGESTYLEVYQGNAVSVTGLQFSMGMKAFNPFIRSKANLNIESGDLTINMSTSAQRIEFLHSGGIFASFDNNSESYLLVSGLGIGTNNPDNASKLEVASTDRFFRLKPMTAVEATAVAGFKDGHMVNVDTTDATFTSVGFWGVEGGVWVKL